MIESRVKSSAGLIAILLFLLLPMVYQCSMIPSPETKQQDLPLWFNSVPHDSTFIFGVGQAVDPDSTRAVQKAVARAQAEILQTIQTEIESIVQIKASELGGLGGLDSSEYLSIRKSMSSAVLTNSEVVLIEWGDEHRVYLLVRCPRMK